MKAQQPAARRRALTRYGAEDRERLIRERAASGLTRKAFCERRGINLGTFYGWSRKRRVVLVKARTQFAEVEVTACTQAAVEVLLPNGARVGIRHPGSREDLVALVRGVAGC